MPGGLDFSSLLGGAPPASGFGPGVAQAPIPAPVPIQDPATR